MSGEPYMEYKEKHQNIKQPPPGFRYFDLISGAFVAVLLISNITATKLVGFGNFPFDGGTLLFPLSYLFADILTEVYGYSRARRVIWLGFMANIVAAFCFWIVGTLPPAAFWENQTAYDAILGLVPRIVMASLIAYLCGEFMNSFVLAKMKIAMQGKRLWMRTIGSTLIGEGVDTLLFVTIAFAGVVPAHDLWMMIAFNYVFKCGMEIVLTPLTYLVVNKLKKHEGKDVFDTNTSFNPFLFFKSTTATERG